jgi:hypothetical protein
MKKKAFGRRLCDEKINNPLNDDIIKKLRELLIKIRKR